MPACLISACGRSSAAAGRHRGDGRSYPRLAPRSQRTLQTRARDVAVAASGAAATLPAEGSRFGFAVATPGAKIEKWDYSVGPLGPEEVDIAVTHNGVCHSDLHMQDNDWGITTFPLIAGHEVVGTVLRKGSEISGLEIGQRVGIGWIRDSCRRCIRCVRGYENLCEKGYSGTIVGNYGGFQPIMRAPADFVYPIPDKLSSADAAPLLCAGITVYAPLRANFKGPGTTVGVIGVGGLGHLAVQIANKMGAEVYAIDVFEDKAKEASSLGAHHFLTPDAAYEQFKGKIDLLLNTASAFLPPDKLLGMLRSDGRLVQLGIPGGNPVINVNLQDVVFNQKSVGGSIVGGRADMINMLEFCAVHGIAPYVEEMKLSQINEAFARVKSGKARYRVVLSTDV